MLGKEGFEIEMFEKGREAETAMFQEEPMNRKLLLKQYIKMFSQKCLLPLCYRFACRRPVKPGLVVFADAHHEQRPENMELLYQYLRSSQRGKADAETKSQAARDKNSGRENQGSGNRETGCEEGSGLLEIQELYLDYQKASAGQVLRHMIRFMKLYAQAGCVVICDNFLPAASCRKRKETRVIQLWHACGCFKKFGYDTEDDIPKQYHGNVFFNTDLVTVSAKACELPFATAMRLPKYCVRALGVSRTDLYFREDWRRQCTQEFYREYPEAAGRKVVLWAPTFRGNPGDPKNIPFDKETLQQQLGQEYLVLTRVHPHMMKKYGQDNCRIPTERLFPVVDVLIADYSSLIYEYALFEKPMILYTPDFEEYTKNRGFYMKFSEIPGLQVMEEEKLAEAVRRMSQRSGQEGQELEEKRKGFIETYMGACDGRATERIGQVILHHANQPDAR